jgi:hypothetical protein
MVAGVPPTILGVTPDPDFAAADVGPTPGMSVATGVGNGVDAPSLGSGISFGKPASSATRVLGVVDAEGSGSAAIAPSGMESKLATSTTDNRPLSSPKSRLVRNITIPLKNKRPKPSGVGFQSNDEHPRRKCHRGFLRVKTCPILLSGSIQRGKQKGPHPTGRGPLCERSVCAQRLVVVGEVV